MPPETFLKAYEQALASQQWEKVAPLIHPDAVVTFSTGAVHKGIAAIEQAYRRNFELIKSEKYVVSDVHWISRRDDVAVYTFGFSWQGIINGQQASGQGRGTAVIILDNGSWKLLGEQLGKG